jgi:hypothetical protein
MDRTLCQQLHPMRSFDMPIQKEDLHHIIRDWAVIDSKDDTRDAKFKQPNQRLGTLDI